MVKKFNIRVYALWIRDNAILVCDEEEKGVSFTKFPGGGLEFGEGLISALQREIREELNISAEISEHFYTTDFFQQSAFNPEDQLVSVYYKIRSDEMPGQDVITEYRNGKAYTISLRWIPLNRFSANDVTFPVDKVVAGMISGTK